MQFSIAKLEVGGGVVTNTYFEILNRTNLCLKSGGSAPPASSVLTVVVTEVRTDGQPALTNVATVTVEAPKTYSRFGIPLLVPVAGHDGSAAAGLPIQALATGTNQDVYVAGMDGSKQAYLQIWRTGFYGDPMPPVALGTNFAPTAMAVAGTNVYIAGSNTDSNTAAVYRYSTEGLPLKTNYLKNGSDTNGP